MMAKADTETPAAGDWRANRSNELSELLRKKIVDAARTCLMKTDYAKLRMDMVAKEAGCSRGTLYRYFSSKDEILLTIAIGNYQLIAETVSREIQDIEDPRLQFATGLARAMALSLSDDNLSMLSMDMVNRALAGDTEPLRDAVAASLAPYLKNAGTQGLLRKNVDLNGAALWILQSSNGLLNTGWPITGDQQLGPQEQVDYLCRYLLHPIFDMNGII